MQIIFYIFIFMLGTCLGSFLCCQARRLHRKSTSPKKKSLGSRSVCLSCGYQLKWYDNIPILSWLFLKGKCRKCHKKIGIAEFLSELGLGLSYLLITVGMSTSGATVETLVVSPLELITFAVTLLFVAILAFLAIYDGLYGELPTLFLTISIICAMIIVILREWASLSVGEDILNIFLAVVILAGLYLLLYLISKGKWVGNGDWLLCLSLALALGTPWLALLVLFLSNLLATVVALPLVKRGRSHKIYFGPFLVTAFVVIFAFSDFFYAIISL